MVSAYAGLLLSLPIILYQLYAFVLPAFSPTERKVALPLLLMVPVLFICGVLFCYYVVLEPATEFLLGFNEEDYTTAVRARDYYSFVALTTIAMGLLFQVPVVILALTRLGITTPETAPQEPPLRDPRLRRPGRAAADDRPADDDPRDDPAAHPLRAVDHRWRSADRAARRRTWARDRIARLRACSST